MENNQTTNINQENNNQMFGPGFQQDSGVSVNQNTFVQNPINTNLNFDNQEDDSIINNSHNKFINSMGDNNSTALNDLNVDGEYHNLPKIDYAEDPTVKANLEQINKSNKKNTITVTSEGLVFIIIVVVLFIFILFIPSIYDAITDAINR